MNTNNVSIFKARVVCVRALLRRCNVSTQTINDVLMHAEFMVSAVYPNMPYPERLDIVLTDTIESLSLYGAFQNDNLN